MRRTARHWLLGGTIAIAALTGGTVGSAAFGGGDDTGNPAAPEIPTDAVTTADADAPGADTIRVHGDWTISVYNADGSLDREVKFSNHLEPSGAATLVDFMRGTATAGVWNIQLWSEGDTVQLCDLSAMNDDPTVCGIHTPSFTPLAGGSPTLDVALGTGPFAGALTLDGRINAARDGQISRVVTQQYACPIEVAADDCQGDVAFSNLMGDDADFTETAVEPIDVVAGQELAVTVVISFS